MAVRIIADSLAITARSSAAVLHARTCRIKSLSLSDMLIIIICWGLGAYEKNCVADGHETVEIWQNAPLRFQAETP